MTTLYGTRGKLRSYGIIFTTGLLLSLREIAMTRPY